MIELVCCIFEKRKTKKRQNCKQFNKITVWKNWEHFSKNSQKHFRNDKFSYLDSRLQTFKPLHRLRL